MKTINIATSAREEFLNITGQVCKEIANSGVKNGLCVITSLHTTAGLTINENADPSVSYDIQKHLSKLAPYGKDYEHAEGNSDAHIKTALLGTSLSLIINGGKPVLGTWQGIFFCEFDGPRSRKVAVEIISSG